ncbi:hypothetical protein E4U19_002590 [Claviceps sp. Clav32 group G5]|nr:hypothetical protein E4U19_002590 [Claviceps sp. Clav32 group G5]
MYSTEERRKLIKQQLNAMTDDQRDVLQHISVYEWFHLPGVERDTSPRHFLPVKALSTLDVIFGDANRINHDCDSNAQHYWNDDTKRLTVHALRDIHPGEEITTSYGSFLNSQKVRWAMFQALFNFECSCRLCSLPDDQMQERDRKVAQFTHMERSLKAPDDQPAFIKLGCCRVQARVYSELGREDIRLAQVYEEAASIAITHGALAKGRVFAQKAASIWTTVAGSDSPEAIKYAALAQKPSRHERYGFSMMWEEAVGEIPQGLGPDDFENWLWNNETPKGLAKPANLSNQSNFSGFSDLPSNDGVETSGSSKKRHCCFLGEIVEDSLFHPLLLDTKDIHGENVSLHFYTKDKGLEFVPKHSQKRHTIVVLDATRYKFKFGPPGIRLEDPRKVQVNEAAASQQSCVFVSI